MEDKYSLFIKSYWSTIIDTFYASDIITISLIFGPEREELRRKILLGG